MSERLRADQTGEALKSRYTKEVLGPPRVYELHYYPIKSCGGTLLQTAEIGPRGIVHDREFMVIDHETGLFKTQREDKLMALVRPDLEGDVLTLRVPTMQELKIPVVREGEIRRSIVWRDTTDGVDQGDEAAEWFSVFLKKPCRLVRMADDFVRQVDPNYAREDDQVGFADGFPFLLTSEASLMDLNRRIFEAHPDEKFIPMNRFRPNIAVSWIDTAFIEDTWAEIQIGEVEFQVAKPCARCPIPQTDQETSRRGKEPMRTLLSFRPKNADGFPYFGQNLIHRNTGALRVGDLVTVLESKKG